MPLTRNDKPSPDASLTLRTLGESRLELALVAGEVTELLGIGKPLALIVYVACAPGREVPRSRLVDLLWADLDPDAARHALRQTLWHIRRRVDEHLLAVTNDSVAIGRPLQLDRDALLNASNARDHERVIDQYAGEFFPGFASPGGAGFEDWADVERNRLRQIFMASAEVLTRKWMNESRFREAQALAKRVRDCSPDHEAGWRLLLEAHLSAGDRLNAALDADELESLTARDELELEPSTLSVIRTVRGMGRRVEADEPQASDASPSALETVLVGREAEFARVLGAWDVVQRGRSWRLAIVSGSGLGKTRLLRDLAVRLRASRARVVTVRASLIQRDLAYALVSDLAAVLAALPGARSISPQSAAVLVGLNPTLSTHFAAAPLTAPGDEGLRQRALALRELIEAVSDEHAVALLIDDLHWCDDSSHRLLMSVTSELAAPRLLLIFSSRPDGRLSQHQGGAFDELLELSALQPQHVGQMVESVAALPDEPWARDFPARLCEGAGGSPLLVLETLKHLLDRGVLTRAGDQWRYARPGELAIMLQSGSPIRTRLAALDRGDRWLLATASCVRRPMPVEFFRRVDDRSTESVAQSLTELERRGFLRREGDRWQTAHDEIADAAMDVAGDDARRAAHVVASRAIWHDGDVSDHDAQLAAALLLSTRANEELRELFGRYAARAYARGDRRPPRALAKELIGTSAPEALHRALVGSTPLRWRLGLVSRARIAAAGVAAIVVSSLVALQTLVPRVAPPPDMVMAQFFAEDPDAVTAKSYELREGAWQDSIPLAPLGKPALRIDGFTLTSMSGTASPSGRGAIVSLAVDDTGGIDLFQAEPDLPIRRLTYARGDDHSPDLNPDGRSLVFTTSRWDSMSHYDLALMDLPTGVVRQLTSGPDTDGPARWSPDGRRIAFVRRRWGAGPTQLCVLEVLSSNPTCWDQPLINAVAGWLDVTHILTHTDSLGRRRMSVAEAETGALRAYDVDWQVHEVTVSPDGRWVYCTCASRAEDVPIPLVFTADRPRRFRRIATGLRGPDIAPIWLSSSHGWLAKTIEVDTRWNTITVGIPHAFEASVHDSLGHAMPTDLIRWSVASGPGTIDSLRGTLVGHEPGRITVVAQVGDSIAKTTFTLVAVPADTATWRIEDWADSSMTQWYRFGWPDSETVQLPDRSHAFLNNGDGSFRSGIASRQAFATQGGLAIDLTASTKAPRRQWQQVQIELLGQIDTARHSRAKGRNVSPREDKTAILCAAGWPVEDSNSLNAERFLGFTNREDGRQFPVNQRLLTGAWYHVRIQLFPDGRCGMALDGKPIAMTPAPAHWFPKAFLQIGGNSFDTKILIGPVRIIHGVPTDIDWSPFLRR
ncbi:MAG: AAA family ATPase [Gemmatimonadaceae bacterium]